MILTIREDKTVTRHGVETPADTRLIKLTKDTIVIKVPGHKYWTALGAPFAYAPGEFEVYRIEEVYPDSTSYKVTRLASFPVRS